MFFAAFGLCLWLLVQPQLIYHGFHRLIASLPRFETGWAFGRESLTTVGGPLAYLHGFLSHCFYFPWAGVAILTLVAGLLWGASRTLPALTRTRRPPLLGYLYAVFVLAGAASYHHGLLVALSVLTALAALVGYVRAAGVSRARAGMLFAGGFAVLFYAAGSAAILFGLLAAFHELAVRRQAMLAGAFAAATLATYSVSTAQFDLPIHFVQSMEIRDTLPGVRLWLHGSVYAMHLLGFLTLGTIALHRHLAARKAAAAERAQHAKAPPGPSRHSPLAMRVVGALLPFALLPLPFYLCSAPAEKLDLLSSYYCSRAEWEKVIELNRRHSQAEHYSVHLNHDLNRALYHTGQLAEAMFTFPQSTPALMMVLQKTLDAPYHPATAIRKIDLWMELGHLGIAERMAFELLENTDGWPLVVEKLALIRLAKRHNETARIFLNALSKDLIRGPAAKRLLQRLDEDPELSTYEPVQYIRSVANETDQPLSPLPMDVLFGDLLRKNPQNRMAFEYMMARYLLTGQAGKFLANIERLKDVGYDAIPHHYEEALAMMVVRGMTPQDLHGYQPGPGAIGEAARFMEVYMRFVGRAKDQAGRKAAHEAAHGAMRRESKHTFMFYNMFGTNREL